MEESKKEKVQRKTRTKIVAATFFLFPFSFFLSFILLAFPGTTPALPPLPIQGPAPLLYVRFMAPPGLNVTFYPGAPLTPPSPPPGGEGRVRGERDFNAPVTVGFRPGYLYRVKLTGFPGRKNLALYPTLEVRGSLQLPKVIRAMDHPAPIVFTREDIDHVLRGSLLTKVILLEHPEQALPTATRPEQPLELEVPPGGDPLAEARTHGRAVLIIRVGEREVSASELAGQAIGGTILLPGDTMLPPPARGPWIPWAKVEGVGSPKAKAPDPLPMVDPLLGPRPPEEECLHDGGDSGTRAGFDRNGQVQGLDPSDTVASYSDSRGRRHLTISNRVCLCVPRFVVVKGETSLIGYQSVVKINDALEVRRESQVQARQPSLLTQQNEQLAGLLGRQRATGTVVTQVFDRLTRLEVLNAHHVDLGLGDVLGAQGMQKLTAEQRDLLTRQIEFVRQFEQPHKVSGIEQVASGPAVVGRVEGVQVTGNVQETRDLTSSCQEPPRAPDQPLYLYKWADARSGQVGDVVTFFLKYANHGGQPITEVAVSDSLTGRLEYIPGSARSDRDAVFTTQENQAGSVILHWEITGRLLPGQSGVVSFQARIR